MDVLIKELIAGLTKKELDDKLFKAFNISDYVLAEILLREGGKLNFALFDKSHHHWDLEMFDLIDYYHNN